VVVVVACVLETVGLAEVVVGDELELVVEQAVEPIAKKARSRTVNRLAIGAS
jgi:hypothetical protein